MPIPALGALTSLTAGGSLTPDLSTSANARSATGDINVGGLNVPPLSGTSNFAIIAVAAVAIFFLVRGR